MNAFFFNMLLVTFGLCMQIYSNLPFSGCSLLKATGNFSSPPSPILHLTHSSTHSNVHEGARLEGNWIRSNPPKLHRARRKEHTVDPKGKGICYLTPALHLISPNCLETISPLVKAERRTSAQHKTSWNLPWWCKSGQPSPCPREVFLFFGHNQASGVTRETSIAGNKRKAEPASAALVLIDIPAEESEYSNVSKLCYLTWESVEIRG